MFFRV